MKYFIPKHIKCMVIVQQNPSQKSPGWTNREVLIDEKYVVGSGDELGWYDKKNDVSYWVFKKDATKIQ